MSRNFETTRWSVVVAAGDSQTQASRNALEVLCTAYWRPLYVFVRGRGYSVEESQDLIQSFLAQFLERKAVRRADPERGRFRTFLLASLKHFLADEWDKSRAQKRGGGERPLRLDVAAIETLGCPEPSHSWTPDRLYDRQWALATLDAALERLRREYESPPRSDLFDALRGTLAGEDVETYSTLAPRLGMTETALKTAAHRLRKRYRAVLKEQVAGTLDAGGDPDAELRVLLEALGG